MSRHVPEQYALHAKFTDRLPNKIKAPAYPHSGYVLNVNVRTDIHRDEKDIASCIVHPFGTFVGGDFIMVEAGLVIRVVGSASILTDSKNITHLNADYKGIRLSLVLHSDEEGARFVDEDSYGWRNHRDSSFSSIPS